jgi:PEP-CTERM motif
MLGTNFAPLHLDVHEEDCMIRRTHFYAVPMIVALMLAASPWQPSRAALFVPGSTFQVEGTNSPGTFTNTANLTPGTTSLDGGALSLTFSIVPNGSNEWLVFSYSTTSGAPLSQPSQDWSINQVGLDAAVPINFIAAFAEFLDNGTALTPTSAIFAGSGYSVMPNPVPGGVGIGQGNSGFVDPIPAGPVGALGAFIDPFGALDGTGIPSADVNGFYQALEFAPQTVVTTPEPASLALIGSGLFAFGLLWRRRRSFGH